MFKKIMVCLDGSALAEKVLPYAIEQAEKFSGELVLYRSVSDPSIISIAMPGMPGVPVETARTGKRLIEDEQAAEKYLKSLAENIQAEKNLPVSYVVGQGPAGTSIVENCDKLNIELITMATHGRSGPGRAVLGSVADYVIRHSGLPILLIRPQ